MDMTCRCKKGYTCVACKVKRGDYKDWMLVKTCCDCGTVIRNEHETRCYACRHETVRSA